MVSSGSVTSLTNCTFRVIRINRVFRASDFIRVIRFVRAVRFVSGCVHKIYRLVFISVARVLRMTGVIRFIRVIYGDWSK